MSAAGGAGEEHGEDPRADQGGDPGEDRGEPDPALAAALREYDASPAAARRLETALAASRVLVPVVPRPAGGPDSGESGPVEMTVPGLVGRDGRLALPVFSCLATLQAWRADVRPVPMPAPQAGAGALDQGYAAVFLDPAGPVALLVEGDRLAALAAGGPQEGCSASLDSGS